MKALVQGKITIALHQKCCLFSKGLYIMYVHMVHSYICCTNLVFACRLNHEHSCRKDYPIIDHVYACVQVFTE